MEKAGTRNREAQRPEIRTDQKSIARRRTRLFEAWHLTPNQIRLR